jgi:anti-anti-sigma factor
MSKLDYLDSSALGMLMLLNERAKLVNKSISLFNPSGIVSQVLEVANFNRLFTITMKHDYKRSP